MAYSLLLLGFSAAIFICYVSYERLFKKVKIPDGAKTLPGPKGYPIIGSVPDLDPKNPWMKMVDWSKEYGTMYQVNLNGDTTVWITSHKICEDLFVKRGAIYSDRPFLAAIGDDCRYTNRYIPLVTNGDDMRRIKTWMKATMSSMPPDRLKGLSQKGAATFVTRLIAQPHLFKQFCEECTAQVSSQMAWNDRRLSTAKETIMRANQLLRRISADGDIQNKLPFLRNIPDWVPDFLQPWKVAERVRYQRERNFWFGEKEEVRKSLLNEKPDPSWMARHLSMPTTPKFEEDNTYSIGMLALIGSILTSSPIQSFFHAMIVSPEWQAKGQEEVDRVCGDRPPNFDDIQQLPVVRAIIREIFRWRSPAPAGVPHVLSQDDVYDGYFLAKGTTCFALEWGLCRDPVLYPDPENFRPERWLSPEFPTYKEPLTHFPSIKANHGFGWGRRACIGQDHVEMLLLTVIATILWSVDIRKQKNEKGEDIEVPWYDYTAYVIVRPEWFPFDVVERGVGRSALLRERADMEMVSGEDGVLNGRAVGYEKREISLI